MVGLGKLAGWALTPSYNGNISVEFAGVIVPGFNVASGAILQGVYGTGTAPATGVAFTGVTCTIPLKYVSASISTEQMGFALYGRITGQGLGVAMWFDLLQTNTLAADGATLQGISLLLKEPA